MPPLVRSTHGLFGHLPPYSLKFRLAVLAQEQRKQGISGGGHGGMSSSHPSNCSVPVDHAPAGSSGPTNLGGGLQTCPPLLHGQQLPPWGSGHPFSCSEIAAGGAGLRTSPPFFVAGNCPSWGSSHSISCHESAAGGAGSPLWGSGHPFSCSKIAAGGAGLLTSPPSFMAGSCPSWGSSHKAVEMAEAEAALAALLLVVEAEAAGILPLLLEAWALDARAPRLRALDARALPLRVLDARAPPLRALDARAPPFWALDARAPPQALEPASLPSWHCPSFPSSGPAVPPPAMEGVGQVVCARPCRRQSTTPPL
ncbi:UNVERIFIED_CONTAM: hypothetical protein FKN15_039725 [Acipenser sinensis]